MITQTYITTSYGKIHLYTKGNGNRKVLLLHGSGCDSAMLSWHEVINYFSDDYTVCAPDLLGYGKSSRPEGLCGENFYPTHIESIRELTKAVGFDKFTLAGISMGGAIAIGYALKYPENVSNLFLADSWGLSRRLPMHRFSNWYIHKTNMTLLQYRWIAKSRFLTKWFISNSLIGDKKKINDKLVEKVMAACRYSSAGKAMLDYQRSSSSEEGAYPYYLQSLKNLKMPVIYINGEKDKLVPPSDSENAAKATPNAAYHLFEGCRHWSVKEKPKTVFNLVDDLYARIQ